VQANFVTAKDARATPKKVFNADSWNPEPEVSPQEQNKALPVSESNDLVVSPEFEALAQRNSMEKYWRSVRLRVEKGVYNASGTMGPLSRVRREWVEQVL
jgi:hypothetical protein